LFDLPQIRCFVAVAEELHFGRAAERLNMTQPPLSRQLQILERILGVPLLERNSRSVRLTPAGASFLPEARRLLRLAESAALVARRVAQGKAGTIRLGFTAASAYGFLPDLVAVCQARLPQMDLSLHEMVSAAQFDALGAGEIDLGLLRPPVPVAGFDGIRVASEPLRLALPQRHPLVSRPTLTLADLTGQPFIMYAPYEARYFYDLLVELFARAEFRPSIVQQLAQVHSIVAMVQANVGVALVPEAAAKLRFAGVVLRELDLPPIRKVELFMAWRRDNTNPLRAALLDVARGLVASA
jgi:DNA-binding transcriptional LysR family regulator